MHHASGGVRSGDIGPVVFVQIHHGEAGVAADKGPGRIERKVVPDPGVGIILKENEAEASGAEEVRVPVAVPVHGHEITQMPRGRTDGVTRALNRIPHRQQSVASDVNDLVFSIAVGISPDQPGGIRNRRSPAD